MVPEHQSNFRFSYHRVHRNATGTNDRPTAMFNNEVQQTECQRVWVARVAEEFHPECRFERERSERVGVRYRGVLSSLGNGELEVFGLRLGVSFRD